MQPVPLRAQSTRDAGNGPRFAQSDGKPHGRPPKNPPGAATTGGTLGIGSGEARVQSTVPQQIINPSKSYFLSRLSGQSEETADAGKCRPGGDSRRLFQLQAYENCRGFYVTAFNQHFRIQLNGPARPSGKSAKSRNARWFGKMNRQTNALHASALDTACGAICRTRKNRRPISSVQATI
jgi:hypothetical protein